MPRIIAIKELKRSRSLPLDVVKSALEGTGELEDSEWVASPVGRALNEVAHQGEFTRAPLLAMGVDHGEIRTLTAMGLMEPKVVSGVEVYARADADLLQTLKRTRPSGLSPPGVSSDQVEAIRRGVETPLALFRRGWRQRPT